MSRTTHPPATALTSNQARKEAEMATEISTNTTPARGLALATFEDTFRFSKLVAASEFAPKDFRGKPEACMLAIQACMTA